MSLLRDHKERCSCHTNPPCGWCEDLTEEQWDCLADLMAAEDTIRAVRREIAGLKAWMAARSRSEYEKAVRPRSTNTVAGRFEMLEI